MRFVSPPADHPPFAALPVRTVSGVAAGHRLAVHVSGRFTADEPPLICLAGFNRNMTDFTDFMRHYREMASLDWPMVLVDLAGRGRSSFSGAPDAYSAVADAADLSTIARALGISRAIFIGQGHGGQVVMALGAQHPSLIAGAVLINSGPTTDPRGLVRLRANLQHIAGTRGANQVRHVMRQILSVDYPGLPEESLDALAARTHFIDRKGRAQPLFDPALIRFLDGFDLDDAFEPQWQLFDTLRAMPLMLVRTDLTDRLDTTTFTQMHTRRPDATTATFSGEASPALLNNDHEVAEIADFVMGLHRARRRRTVA